MAENYKKVNLNWNKGYEIKLTTEIERNIIKKIDEN